MTQQNQPHVSDEQVIMKNRQSLAASSVTHTHVLRNGPSFERQAKEKIGSFKVLGHFQNNLSAK
jgi:hypothetical protein